MWTLHRPGGWWVAVSTNVSVAAALGQYGKLQPKMPLA